MIAHASSIEHLAVVAIGATAVVLYGVAWLRQVRRRWSRLLAWSGGVLVVLVATSPPIERVARETFTGHMVQHLMLLAAAPPLFVVARPVRVLSSHVGSAGRVMSSGVRSIAGRARVAGPVLAPVAFLGFLFVSHLTGLYDLALRNRLVHDLEHVAYLLSALALWAVVLGAGHARAGARVAAAFAVIGGSAVLGIVLTSANRPLFPSYVARLGVADALEDQRLAASLMWVGGMALSLPLLMVSVWRWAATEERVVRRSEMIRDGALVPADPPASDDVFADR